MTNDELSALKELAKSCYIFGSNNDEKLDEKSKGKLRTNNEMFFVQAVKYMPDLIDELLKLREL